VTVSVSIIVPCYNEEGTIGLLLDAIHKQSFLLHQIEVILADGLSTDGTRDVVANFQLTHPELRIKVVDNPKRIIPAAINIALEHVQGEVVIRLDAHSIPHKTYVERCVTILEHSQAANVGGVWEIEPGKTTWIGRGIARAASHPLGAGDARYRFGGEVGEVETVPFGAFRKEWLDRIGEFDENLLTNEDYEYNHRIRQAGGKIWFDPSIRCVYFARGDLTSLAKQYMRYGYWKAVMLIQNPLSLRWRQALPVLFVLGIIFLTLLSIWISPARIGLAIYIGLYCAITAAVGVVQSIRFKDPGLMLGFPLALWVMHLSWGGAFLYAILTHWIWRSRG
jgi:glycosyltransferase involved in cell wall biosynthesis